MKINYNITGEKRKALVGAISQELNAPVKYLGAPTFAYEVGGYHIDKNGTLEGDDNLDLVADLCGLHSFQSVSEEYDVPMTYDESLGGLGALETFEDLKLTEEEELGLGKQRRDQHGEDGMQASDVPDASELDSLTIEMPLVGFTEEGITNLVKLIASKAALIKKAIGTDVLPIERTETTLKFPWFRADLDGETVAAYTHFIHSICEMARNQKHISSKEKKADNEKYAFRCFLLRLGFIGEDYKEERKILLQNLSGSSAYKGGAKNEISK